VHAAVLTVLYSLAVPLEGLSPSDQDDPNNAPAVLPDLSTISFWRPCAREDRNFIFEERPLGLRR
jgi:hypothetical protein